MIKNLLDGLGITNRESRFIKPPQATSYVVWFDNWTRRGADTKNLIKEHDYTLELYEYAPDIETEKKIETALDEMNIEFDKSERQFLESEQLYTVIYEFTTITKEEKTHGRN